MHWTKQPDGPDWVMGRDGGAMVRGLMTRGLETDANIQIVSSAAEDFRVGLIANVKAPGAARRRTAGMRTSSIEGSQKGDGGASGQAVSIMPLPPLSGLASKIQRLATRSMR